METKDLFYAPVRKVACKDIIPETNFLSYNDHAIIMNVAGQDTIVNFCSEDYGLLPTYDLFPKIEEVLAKEFDFDVNYSVRNMGRFYADFKIKGFEKSIGKKDFVNPVVRFAHSYNSQIMFNGSAGHEREICTNGLWGLVMEHMISLSHTKNNVEVIVGRVFDMVTGFIANIENENMRLEALLQKKIKVAALEERVKEIIEETGFYKSVEKEIMDRINFEKTQNNLPLTNWLLYNAFNYQLNHNDKLSGAPEDKMKKDRAVFAYLSGEALVEEE